MKKAVLISGIAAVVIIVLGFVYFSGAYNKSADQSGSNINTTRMISLDELALHNNENSCWVIYQNKVYDLTSWLSRHPGGVNAILQYCGGTGFEEAFYAKHGTTKASLFMKVAILIGDLKLQGNLGK